MELLSAILIGILTATGTYLILAKKLLPIIIGTNLLSYGAILFLLTSGGLKWGSAPIHWTILTSYVDPLPQAFILTAIVINFAVTAFCLVLAYRTYQATGTDNVDDLIEEEEKEASDYE